MFTVPLEAFLQMTIIHPYEKLMEQGVLREFQERMGKAMFVSHQWLNSKHPDPQCEQLRVLQKALKNALSGASLVSLPPAIELLLGRLKCPTPSEFKGQPLYLWYDYFCCPQGTSTEAADRRHQAIASIPEFVSRSYFFLILCPAVPHAEGHLLSCSTWSSRGWCRLEKTVRDLAREDGYIITVTSPNHLNLGWNMHGVGKAPGLGSFSFEDDRARVGQVVLSLIWAKLQDSLREKDLHKYRFLLNLHHFHFAGIEGLDRVESLIPDFSSDIDPASDPEAFIVARFLHDNCFKTVLERDSAGWSPLCYAVVNGDAFLVKALLKSKADPNDRLSKNNKKVNLPKNMPVVCMAAAYYSNDVLEVLLAHRASVNARCSQGATPLAWAASSDNAAAVGILSKAFADPLIKVFPNTTPFRLACGFGSVAAMKEMLIEFPVRLRFCLHTSLVFFGDVGTVCCLIEAAADVNEQFRLPYRNTWWFILNVLHARHYLSPSALTNLAYHHRGATPLMFSILTGKFEIMSVLVKAGADLNCRNDRGKTAADLLSEMHVPLSLSSAVLKLEDGEDSDDSFSI